MADSPSRLRGPLEGARCFECPLAVDGRADKPVLGIGPENPEWIIVGEGPGRTEVQWGEPLCLVGETRVLGADLHWHRLDSLAVGDEIITINEHGDPARGLTGASARRWVKATITNKVSREAETWEVITDRGDLRGTRDHRVLVASGRHAVKARKDWRRIDKLIVGERRKSHIAFPIEPWYWEQSYAAAWLAGFFDGEGCVDNSARGRTKYDGSRTKIRLGFCQNEGPTEKRALEFLRQLGFKMGDKTYLSRGGVTSMRHHVLGGFAQVLRFLGAVRPGRLLTNFDRIFGAGSIYSRITTYGEVQRRGPTGRVESVVDITTTAGTFIANGFLVHNCGPTGQVVNRMLSDIGVDRRRVWLMNVTACMPGDGQKDEVREKAAECCRPRVENELKRMPGKPLLLLGGVATKELTKSKLKITKLTGTYHEVDVDGTGPRGMIATIHPAALLRAKGGKGSSTVSSMGYVGLKFDGTKVKALAAGKLKPLSLERGTDIDWELEDSTRANALFHDLLDEVEAEGSDRFLGIDLETYVDNPLRNWALQGFIAKIRFLGLATKKRGVSVLWELLSQESLDRFARILKDSSITKGFHNLAYDCAVLQNQHYGFVVWSSWEELVEVLPLEDTLLGHHAAFPGSPHHLQAVACWFRAIPPWKAEFRDGDESLEEEAEYNVKDIFCTSKSVDAVHFWIKKTRTEEVYDIDRKMAACAARMHLDGYWVDGDVNQELTTRLSSVIDACRDDIMGQYEANKDKILDRLAFEKAKTRRKADPADFVERIAIRTKEIYKDLNRVNKKTGELNPKLIFSPGNDWHMIAFLKALGVQLTKQTEKGRTSTAASVLEDLVHIPQVATLLRFRANETLFDTFVWPMFEWKLLSDGKTWRAPHVQEDGRCHAIWSVNKKSGRWGSEDPPCFDAETEIMTKRGWIRMDQVTQDDEVAQYHAESGQIDFTRPREVHRYPYKGEMVKWFGECADMLVTPNHRILLENRRKEGHAFKVVAANDLFQGIDQAVPISGDFVGGHNEDVWWMRFLVAVQADGHLKDAHTFSFGLMKERKIVRLREILSRLGMSWTEKTEPVEPSEFNPTGADRIRFYVNVDNKTRIARQLVGSERTFGPWLLDFSAPVLDEFLSEIMFWDGSFTRQISYSSSQRVNADWVQAVAHLRGRCGRLRPYFKGKLQKTINWQVDTRTRRRISGAKLELSRVEWNNDVFCVTVPSGFVLVRRGQSAYISGNSQNWSRGDERNKDPTRRLPNIRRQAGAPPGRRIVAFDFEQLEARTMAVQSDDEFLCTVFAEGRDIHSEFAIEIFPDFKQYQKGTEEFTQRRDITKRLEYGGLYGGADDTVWKSIVIDFPEVSLAMVSAAIRKIKMKVAGVLRWQQRLLIECGKPPYEFRCYAGDRRAVWPMGEPSPNDVSNYPNQFFGAHIMNTGLARMLPKLDKYKGRVFPILQVHDASYFECDDDDKQVESVARDVKDAFTQWYTSPSGVQIEFPVEIKHGYYLHDHVPDLAWPGVRDGLKKFKFAA